MSSNLAYGADLPGTPAQSDVTSQNLAEPLGGKFFFEERVVYGQQCELRKGIWGWLHPSPGFKPVALKYIRLRALADNNRDQLHGNEKISKRFVREISTWITLKHINILPFYGYQRMDEDLILVSRWSETQNLDRFLALHPELTIIDKLELLYDAACGLEFLHSTDPPTVHGGIQPNNVIITDELRAVLSDVALSSVMGDLGIRVGLSSGGQAAEFAGYQAKELLLYESPPTPMADVYAFGGLTLLTLSGKGPFWKNCPAAVVLAIAAGSTPETKDHPRLSPEDRTWATLRACWDIRPDSRPDITTVKEKLKDFASSHEASWRSTAPQRTLNKIPIVEGETSAVGNAGSIPRVTESKNLSYEPAHHQDREPNTVVTKVPKGEPSRIASSEDLIRLEGEPTPATEQVVLLLKEISKVAITARRHNHKIHSIVLRARDICNYILSLGERLENQQPPTAKGFLEINYSNIIGALEGELRKMLEIQGKEKTANGPEDHSIWLHSRAAITDIQAVLSRRPFNAIPPNPSQDAVKDSFLDDCSWISLLLHNEVEPAIVRRFPNSGPVPEVFSRVQGMLNYIEAELKRGNHEEAARQLVIDILSRLSETLSTSPSTNATSLTREGDTSALQHLDQQWLFHSLSDACSAIDLRSALKSTEIQELGQKWEKISGDLDLRRRGRMFREEERSDPIQMPSKPVELAGSVVQQFPSSNASPAIYDGPSISWSSSRSDPVRPTRILLNIIQQAGHATFEVKTQVEPPFQNPTWTAVVTVTSVAPALVGSIYIGTSCIGFGSTKSAARDVACEQMLNLFAKYGI